MNRPRIVPLGIALAMAFATSSASAAVAYYPDGYVVYEDAPAVRVERVSAPEMVAYNDRYVTYATAPDHPQVVERYVVPRETVVVRSDPVIVTAPRYTSTHWDPRHPHWGHLIDYGLFNRRGPNDFGR